MPFGAHETMEMHEVLMEKINVITHFNLYAKQTKNPQLLDMIVRHQQEEMRSYNEIIAFTRGNSRFSPIPSNTEISGISNQQIQYGLSNPPQFAPQADATLNDNEIAIAMLLCHKNGARNCSWASLECADPNLRRTLFNSAATCTNQAYEVFLFMNEQGLYQVPTLNSQTAETLLHRYQPASESLEAQYAMHTSQGLNGYSGQGQTGHGTGGYSYTNMPGSGGSGINGNLFAGSRDSFLYGDAGGGGSSTSYGAQSAAPFGRGPNDPNARPQ
jgi:spore coat protein CotF